MYRISHNSTCAVLTDRGLTVKTDGRDEVVAQAGKAEDLGTAIDTGVHRPPRRVVTQRDSVTSGDRTAR